MVGAVPPQFEPVAQFELVDPVHVTVAALANPGQPNPKTKAVATRMEVERPGRERVGHMGALPSLLGSEIAPMPEATEAQGK